VLEDQEGDRVALIFENKLFDHNLGLPYTKFDVKKAPFIVKVSGGESRSDDLDWLVDRYRRRRQNKKSPGRVGDVHSLDEAVKKFLRCFRAGFRDSKYLAAERDYKLQARERMLEKLGRDQMQELLSSGSYDEIWQRAYRLMTTSGQLVHFIESSDLSRALDSPGRKQLFSQALAILLWSEDPLEGRFKAFAQMLLEIKSAKWPVMTYFLFLTFSDTQIVLKPTVAQEFAEICKKKLCYEPEVNWGTYEKFLDLAEYTREELSRRGQEDLVPRDMIDVQSFMWVAVKWGPDDVRKAVSPGI
jgi:hypothetical protein